MKTILFLLILVTGLVISNASAQTEINVTVNSDSFEQGKIVMITGSAEEGTVAVQVKDPSGMSILVRSVTADSNGNFELEFKIPQTATLGDYVIVASIIIDDLPVISHTLILFFRP